MATIEENKKEFIALLRSTNKQGIDDLISWLEHKSDFFTAPSSTKFHGNYAGGLCQHSLNVYYAAKKLFTVYKELSLDKTGVDQIKEEEIIISALLHDICKTNFYKPTEKWYKDKANNWQSYIGYEIEDKFPMGHGEKSVFMVQQFIRLTGNEALAIRWHMGNSDPGMYISPYTKNALNDAFNKVPLCAIIAQSDQLASWAMETMIEPKA